MSEQHSKVQEVLDLMARKPKKRGPGRPRKPDKMGPRRFCRFPADLEAALKVTRDDIKKRFPDVVVDLSWAIRELVRAGAIAKGLLAPSSNGQS